MHKYISYYPVSSLLPFPQQHFFQSILSILFLLFLIFSTSHITGFRLLMVRFGFLATYLSLSLEKIRFKIKILKSHFSLGATTAPKLRGCKYGTLKLLLGGTSIAMSEGENRFAVNMYLNLLVICMSHIWNNHQKHIVVFGLLCGLVL